MEKLTDVADRLRLEIDAMLRQYPELGEDEVLRADMLEGATDIKEVLSDLANRLGDAKALAAGLQTYLDDLEKRLGRYLAREELLREVIFRVMDAAQIKKMELPHVTLSLKKSPQRLLGDIDVALLPDDLCRIKREVDRKKVREALEAGRVVPGFALSNAGPVLMVRVG